VLKKFPHLFLVLLIEGGALMAVELMGAKLVAPFYGGSLYAGPQCSPLPSWV
jgi:hypothetical protein